jgi:hypothetical protein
MLSDKIILVTGGQQRLDKCWKCKRFEGNIANGGGNYAVYCGLYSRPLKSCQFEPIEKDVEKCSLTK